jgi:hypothetical protein
MYMIFQGQVTISLETKNENEYFNLYPTNYFGDYQILLGLKSNEFYKASGSKITYCHCIKKRELMDIMTSFPVAHSIFTDRATHRRIEFRRIKKQFEQMANIHQFAEQD